MPNSPSDLPAMRSARPAFNTVALRLAWRDWTSGDVRVLLLALILAITAMSAVGFFADRLRQALAQNAAAMLGGDWVLASDRALAPRWQELATRLGLRSAVLVSFPSMVVHETPGRFDTQLVAVKAVPANYPLLGSLKVQRQGQTQAEVVRGQALARTAVWVDAGLLNSLHLAVGDVMKLGELSLVIDGVIVHEPDRSFGFASFSPRVMIAEAALADTGLLGPGSRATWRLAVAGPATAVTTLQTQTSAWLEKGQRVEKLEGGRPELQTTMERAEQFLALAAILTTLIAAIAVVLAARRFVVQRMDTVAILRCLGCSRAELRALFALEFGVLSAVACGVGSVGGFIAHFGLLGLAERLQLGSLPWPTWAPVWKASLSGILVMLAFAAPMLARLMTVPALRVLRRSPATSAAGASSGLKLVLPWIVGAAASLGLIGYTVDNPKTATVILLGFVAVALGFWLVAWVLLQGLRGLRAGGRGSASGLGWRYALAGLSRRPNAAALQLVALAIGLTAMMLLTVVQRDLVASWRQAAPADAPNRFVLNLQLDQVAPFEAMLREQGLAVPQFYPMIRARLTAINGKSVDLAAFSDERAQRLLNREFNLSYAEQLPSYNRLVAGRWWSKGDEAVPAGVSVELSVAQTLGLQVGDRLTWSIGGNTVESVMSSVRSLRWDSMQANFFVMGEPRLLREQAQTWMSAFYLPPEHAAASRDWVQRFPNLTVIDTQVVVDQIQGILNQVISAVSFLFGFALVAGFLVMLAALADTQDERMQEAVILRTLGASSGQLRRMVLIELTWLGGLAGFLAALAAMAVAWALGRWVLDMPVQGQGSWLVLAMVTGVACALLAGWFSLRQVLRVAPMQQLSGG